MGFFHREEFLEDKLGSVAKLFKRPVVVRVLLSEEKYLIIDAQAISCRARDVLLQGANIDDAVEDESPANAPEEIKPKRRLRAVGFLTEAWEKSFK